MCQQVAEKDRCGTMKQEQIPKPTNFMPGDIFRNVLFGTDGWKFLWNGGQR